MWSWPTIRTRPHSLLSAFQLRYLPCSTWGIKSCARCSYKTIRYQRILVSMKLKMRRNYQFFFLFWVLHICRPFNRFLPKKRDIKEIVIFIHFTDTWSNRAISEEVIEERSENAILSLKHWPYYEQYSS